MTAPLAALLAAAWTLIVVIGVWSVVGLYLRDRRPRRGGESGATTASTGKGPAVTARPRRPCGAAGPAEIGEQRHRASRQTGPGGPKT